MSIVHRPTNNFTFQFRTSRAFLSHFSQNEWVFDSRCIDHMAKYASLFTRLNIIEESKNYVVYDFSLDDVGHGDVACRHGNIFDVYHVPNISVNLLSVAQLN
jgi:hypothetical protein